MTEAEKAYQYFVISVPENEEQAKAYFWARKALQSTLTPPNEPRMINADKLAKRIAGHSNYHGDSILVAIYCAAEGKENDAPIRPIETPQNEWVSVEDAVPDPGVRVLATDGIFVGEAYRASANSWFRHTGFPWRDGVTGRTVRFWMPMPASPDRRPPEGEADA